MLMLFIKLLLAAPVFVVLSAVVQPELWWVSSCIGFVAYMFSDLYVNSWEKGNESRLL